MQIVKFDAKEEITKSKIDSIVKDFVQLVGEGLIDPMEVAIRVKANEDILKELRKQIDEMVLEEAAKYEKGQTYLGVEPKVVQGRKKFDFSEDAEWSDLKAKLAAREAYLKAKPQFDPETGEQSPVKVSYGKDYVTLKFPK